MKKNWMKWVLCLALAVAMLACTALAAAGDLAVAADADFGATITGTGGTLSVTVPAAKVTADTQYAVLVVAVDKTQVTVAADATAEQLLTAVKAATSPYTVGEDTILYIDQAAATAEGLTFTGKPKSAADAVIILGGKLAGQETVTNPQILGVIKAQGVAVTGTVTVKGAAATDTTATVELGGETKTVNLTNGAGTYSFDAVPAGEYTLKVSSGTKYVAREYTVNTNNGEVAQNVEICPKGDATGDGKVNLNDYRKVLQHVRKEAGKIMTEGSYDFKCSDTTGDGKINLNDYRAVLQHVRGTKPLW